MASRAQKLRDHKARMAATAADLPELASVPRRYQSGRKQASDRDPQRTVLKARCAHMGKDDTRENRRMMKAAMMGDPAGQAISIGAGGPRESERLWQAFSALDAVDDTYHRRILHRSRHAKCGKVEYMPERFEARDDDKSDARTDEQKDRDASSAWMRWHGAIGHLSSHDQSAIWDGIYLRGELHKGGKLTAMGKTFVQSMRAFLVVCTRRGLIS